MDNRNNYCLNKHFELMLSIIILWHWCLSTQLIIVIIFQTPPPLLLACKIISFICVLQLLHHCINERLGQTQQKFCALCLLLSCVFACAVVYMFISLCVDFHVCTFIFCYSETFSFMLTGEDGSRRFGYCRRLLVSHHLTLHPLLPVHTLLSPVCCDRAFYVNMWYCFPVEPLMFCMTIHSGSSEEII